MNNQAHSPVFIKRILSKYNRIYFNIISAGGNMINKILMSVKLGNLLTLNDIFGIQSVLYYNIAVCRMNDECAMIWWYCQWLFCTEVWHSTWQTDPRILFVLLLKFVIIWLAHYVHRPWIQSSNILWIYTTELTWSHVKKIKIYHIQ